MITRDKELDHLNDKFKLLVYKFLATLMDCNIPVMVIETLRSQEAHDEDLKTGHSWIKRSKHQDGLAIDICPYEIYQLNGPDKLQWDANEPIWLRIGQIGESCNLVWGGRWKQKDLGHFEYKGEL